ncbi:hypothetical protein [Nocardioides daejeonensis]|uniref:hypothetical protein n=1 Tax=Nocardioides daejeonensis TaxID=1046556 RepID=UPI000D749B06|nr:hypothetical protein [Nocardioides daejeonensis]
MKGLTVRWSLVDAAPEVNDRLADYVADASHERFEGKPGLAFKTWRMRAGEWFEGCYVFESDEERTAFQETFTAGAAESAGSLLIGSAPILIEECDILAVAQGAAGFASTPRA